MFFANSGPQSRVLFALNVRVAAQSRVLFGLNRPPKSPVAKSHELFGLNKPPETQSHVLSDWNGPPGSLKTNST